MFQTFSGASRRPRQVNLSGQSRHTSFGSTQQTSRPSGPGGHSAVIQAQQERRARQLERERLQAAKTVQRHWRGHTVRRRTRTACRGILDKRWADTEQGSTSGHNARDVDEQEQLQQAKLLAWFASPRDTGDVQRVCLFAGWLDAFVTAQSKTRLKDEWRAPLTKISRFALSALKSRTSSSQDPAERRTTLLLLQVLAQTAEQFPDSLARLSKELYASLSHVASHAQQRDTSVQRALTKAIIDPLLESADAKLGAYEGFTREFLTVPGLHEHVDLTEIAVVVQHDMLAKTTRAMLNSTSKDSILTTVPQPRLLWTLAYFIHLHRLSSSKQHSKNPNIDFTAAITIFLSHLGDVIGQGQDIHDTTRATIIPKFVNDEIASLINQRSIMSLIPNSNLATTPNEAESEHAEDAAVLASYALILLRSFPRRADDIRGWLYMSSTPATREGSEEPAIKFFWRAVERSHVYEDVSKGANKAVQLLKRDSSVARTTPRIQDIEQEWRVIFLFLELYTFVLKIMDDDEFMTGNTGTSKNSWTRQSALALSSVRGFTIFLKNLAFAMYWNASDIMGTEERVEPQSLAAYFGQTSSEPSSLPPGEAAKPSNNRSLAGVEGMTLTYMKGMVTGLLRMLYERDSRRHFCDTDHWLMEGLEMKGFIEAVVVEQAFRDKQAQDAEDEEIEQGDAMDLDVASDDDNLVGTTRTQQIRRDERRRTQQQRSSRMKLLQSLTPRLEILQNMPFFIPFATRVEIFRQFVTADQIHRRNGLLDPDQWRFSMSGGMTAPSRMRMGMQELEKHSAKVRREHVFDDAFKQFFELGEGLKEPIHITFVDQFDTPEAGIDGGGVTKEFLTSITNEAFSTEHGGELFVENDEHLVYPNPSAVDERRERLREAGIPEGSPEWNTQIRELLQQYEFLGRVVGKCLYEGILEDIHFAPFFLVKWALTGGSSAASNESGYRANINDLRDLDQELYDNLLKLKNYPGNVEDFGLDFTITDVVQRDSTGAPTKSITRDLRHRGANIAVNNTNRLIYISAVARHRLQSQPAAQTNAFLQGLAALIQPAWLSMFNQSELQTLLGGDASEINVADLRANTQYGGVYVIGDDGLEHPTVQHFWDVLTEMGDADRRKVLKYVTSTPRGPLLGFNQLNPRFSIRDSGSDQSRLPSTSTCVNLLKLPIYHTKEVLREKLLYAVNAGAGFNLS